MAAIMKLYWSLTLHLRATEKQKHNLQKKKEKNELCINIDRIIVIMELLLIFK